MASVKSKDLAGKTALGNLLSVMKQTITEVIWQSLVRVAVLVPQLHLRWRKEA
jgi:hypothetical protein